ncbi:MAG: alanine racemase [Lautropia sp.]|nr:alanine racemase [Lautropia sp.]
MSRNTTATTSIGALAHNLWQVKQAAPGARVWGVVKANGYGHGLLAAMRGFDKAQGLALLEFEGAFALREAGWTRPILMIEGAFEAADVALASRLGLSLVVHDLEQVAWLEASAGAGAGPPLPVYLKINTGLNRLGVPAAAARPLHARLSHCRLVASVGVMTHFANADLPGGALAPMQRFDEATAGLPGERSLANSAALLTLPHSQRDWVRPGIVLYGATPFADRSAASFGFRPAMRLTSSLIAVQDLQPGDSVGYGSNFTAASAMRVGIVSCGYADGYPRLAPTGTPIAVGGVRTRTVGRVSMDMLAADISALPAAVVGTPVELWGSRVHVDEVAAGAGTIGYDLLCAVTARVRREVTEDFDQVAT